MSSSCIFWVLVIVVASSLLALAFYIRLVPADPDIWHLNERAPAPGNYSSAGGFLAVRTLDGPAARALAQADALILTAPRTTWYAGSLAEGRVTYVTRSSLWGFPDYTTVWTEGSAAPIIAFHGRARFGSSDMGVNRARIEGWLEELGLTRPDAGT